MKLILTDIDETILKFAEPFEFWLKTVGIKTSGNLMDCYNIEKWLNIDYSIANYLMLCFGRSKFMKNQPPFSDALVILPKLYNKGFRFIGITACGQDKRFAKQRIKTISTIFGFDFETVHFVDHYGSKEKYLSIYKPTIWVEDNFEHAKCGAKYGHKSFLITRPYNKDDNCKDVTRVTNWYDIKESI